MPRVARLPGLPFKYHCWHLMYGCIAIKAPQRAEVYNLLPLAHILDVSLSILASVKG